MFAAVLGQLGTDETLPTPAPKSSSPHLLKVAAGVRQMQERSELAEKLLKDGEQIVELDPDHILPSVIHDRFEGAYDDAIIAELTESMRERGQIVPGLVRPVPGRAGAFQIVYGRRRLAAAKKLGLKFKAAVRELTDEQAVIFQGEENSAREDLSFIEKCSFALAQEAAGYGRETICASLSTGKSHVSEMIKIALSVPKEILLAIGAAPGIGRGRWEDFVRRYTADGNASRAADLVREDRFRRAGSDERFNLLLSELAAESDGAAKQKAVKPASRTWAPIDKSVSVTVKQTGKAVTFAVSESHGNRFGTWISENLDDLYEAFRKSGRTPIGD